MLKYKLPTMNPLTGMIYYALLFIIIIWQYSSRDLQGMDAFDRFIGIAGEGRTRGMLGTVYNADGTYSYTYNILDIIQL
jgi:hypothetical protein